MAFHNEQFHAEVGGHTYAFSMEGSRLMADGQPVDYRFSALGDGYYALIVDGHSTAFVVAPIGEGVVRITAGHRQVNVRVKDARALLLERFGLADDDASAEREVRAPMPGLVLKIAVSPGQDVNTGDSLLVLEAMKMENEIRAVSSGMVETVHVAPGDAVGKNELLIELAS